MSIKTPTSSIENQSKFEQQDPTVRICVPSRNEYIALMLQNGRLKTRKISQRYYKSQGTGNYENVDVLPFRANEIPTLVAETPRTESEWLHAGFAGQDLVKEAGVDSSIIPIAIIPLSNGGKSKVDWKCLVKEESSIRKPSDLIGKIIGTQAPKITQEWLIANGIDPQQVEIRMATGSGEAYLKIGRIDALVDVVDTGKSRDENKLRELEGVVFQSQGLLIANRIQWSRGDVREKLREIAVNTLGSILSVKTIMINADVPNDKLESLKNNPLFKGVQSPTIVDLGNGFSSYAIAIPEEQKSAVNYQLLKAGADGILAIPTESYIDKNAVKSHLLVSINE